MNKTENQTSHNRILKLNIEAYQTIFHIENMVRSIILKEMKQYNVNWWIELNSKYVDRVEELKETDDGEMSKRLQLIQKQVSLEKKINSYHVILMHDIYYTNLMDLWFIIKRYWDEVFCKVITGVPIDHLRKHFETSNRIRNKVMHSKPITEWELNELQSFKSFLEEKMQFNRISSDYFDNYTSLNLVMEEFSDEIKTHQTLVESESYSKNLMEVGIYSKYNSEWWWNSNTFQDYKMKFMFYYGIVEKINVYIKKYKKDLVHLFEIEHEVTRTNFKKENNRILKEIKN